MISSILNYIQKRKIITWTRTAKSQWLFIAFHFSKNLFNKCSSLNTEINKKLMIDINILFNIHCFTWYKMETGSTQLNGLKIWKVVQFNCTFYKYLLNINLKSCFVAVKSIFSSGTPVYLPVQNDDIAIMSPLHFLSLLHFSSLSFHFIISFHFISFAVIYHFRCKILSQLTGAGSMCCMEEREERLQGSTKHTWREHFYIRILGLQWLWREMPGGQKVQLFWKRKR